MFLVRKDDVSIAFFTEVETFGNKVVLKDPENVEFLYHMLYSMSLLHELNLSIYAKDRTIIKLNARISELEITDTGIELVVV